MNVLIEGLLLAVMGLDALATRNPDSCIHLFFISDGSARSAASSRRRGMFEKNGRTTSSRVPSSFVFVFFTNARTP